MAAGAYSDVAILGLTYAEDAVNAYPDSEPENEVVAHEEEEKTRRPSFDPLAPCWCEQEDFIIFSEFSEVQGPLPLLTIPSHIQEDNEFDMNGFILKIMSVDYQANPSGHFILSDDAQVLQLSLIANLHTYVHYFTLHDVHARGFVRPMCLAYVTKDKRKLQQKFPEMRNEFLKQEEEGEALAADDHQILMTTEIDQLVQQYTEYKHLHHIVEPTIENSDMKQLFAEWEDTFVSSDLQEARNFLKKLSSNHAVPLSPGHVKSIRPVLAISPWGCLTALSSLLNIIQTFSKCSLHVDFNVFHTSFTPAPVCKPPPNPFNSSEALLNKEFLQLTHNLTYPKEWGGDESMDATVASQNDLDYLDAHFLASGNEGSSSYHSAPSSVRDLPTPTLCIPIRGSDNSSSSESSQSFHDVTEDLTDNVTEEMADWSISSGDERDETDNPQWSGCLWRDTALPSQQHPGSKILQFFLSFPQCAQHILYSILIGRTVILSGNVNQRNKARSIANALTPLLPGSQPAAILRWHQGIIVPAHIEKFKIIGMCVAERLSVHDMISPKDENSVTILELGSKQLCGPAYSGKLLNQLEPPCISMLPSDQSLLLLLQAIFTELDSQAFLCHTLGIEQMKELGLRGCDLTIVKHLASICRNQQA